MEPVEMATESEDHTRSSTVTTKEGKAEVFLPVPPADNIKYQLPEGCGVLKMEPVEMATESEDRTRSSTVTTKEGKAEVFLPTSVFYNPVQEFNRDLTIVILSQYAKDHFIKLKTDPKKLAKKNNKADEIKMGKTSPDESVTNIASSESHGNGSCGFSIPTDDVELINRSDIKLKAGLKYEDGLHIFEGLAASGLRSVRFALEVPGVNEIVANDLNTDAVDFIKKNIARNQVESLVKANCADAKMFMYQNRHFQKQFDVIDLDPYGSPSVFLDSAVQAVKDGGLLCVTCTDMAILCGNAAETCFAKYGAMSYRSNYCHEMALRIVLHSIQSHASRYSRYIVPLLSISVDFYVRVFVRVYTGQIKVKEVPTKLAMTYHCVGCGTFNLQRLAEMVPAKGSNVKYCPASGPPVSEKCRHCKSRHIVGGPIWIGELHENSFLQKVVEAVAINKADLRTTERIQGVLSVAIEELPDQPLFYVTDELCKVLHCASPKMLEIRSAILHAGYRVSLSHAEKNSIKTDAPMEVIWDILRCWVKLHPVSSRRLKEGSVAKAILDTVPQIEANFSKRADANPASRRKGLLRWQENPERDWGPKAKARSGEVDSLEERRVKGMEKAKERLAKRHQSDEENDSQPLKKIACDKPVSEAADNMT